MARPTGRERRGDMSKKIMSVREFLADIAANEILPNKKYALRIDSTLTAGIVGVMKYETPT